LIFIRNSPSTNSDQVIKTKNGGISIKFFITLRKDVGTTLVTLKDSFNLVIYSSLDREMSDGIIDFLERTYNDGQPIFVMRLYSNDCNIVECSEKKN